MRPAPLAVVKVGGGLLGSADDFRRVVAAVAARRRAGERVLVVVSAVGGVTDLLDSASVSALDPRAGGEIVRDAIRRLRERHVAVTGAADDALVDGVERLLTGIRLTGELTPRTRDLLLAHGERLCAPLFAAAVRAAGADARAIGAEEAGLAAIGPFGVGRCDLDATAEGLAGLQHELHDRALVLTGFYGIDSGGDVVTFGRGGSDYTAGVVAAGLGADRLELWKNVPGFLTADPEAVPGARLVPELSFAEARELGFYGARILHPRCLDPLRGGDTAVSVRPVDPVGEEATGTRLVERREGAPAGVAAIAARRDVAVLRVQDAGMVNTPGVAARVLGAVAAAGVDVGALATSMTSLSFTVDDRDAPVAQRELRLLAERGAGPDEVAVLRGAALLAVVGDGVAGDASIAARMLACLADLGLRVELVSHGPRDVGLSCAVPEADRERALDALHARFFAARTEARAR